MHLHFMPILTGTSYPARWLYTGIQVSEIDQRGRKDPVWCRLL